MPVETGDSIITGYDGYAELEMEDGSTVKVSEDSIFALSSFEQRGKEENTFQCVLGSVQYKFTKAMKENEPRITTPSTVLRNSRNRIYGVFRIGRFCRIL